MVFRLPDWLEEEMLFNQLFACVCGTVPILGDLVVAIFGCNARNVVLLEEFLAIRGAENLKAEGDRRYNPEDIKPGAGMEPGESLSHSPSPNSSPAPADSAQLRPLISSKDQQV